MINLTSKSSRVDVAPTDPLLERNIPPPAVTEGVERAVREPSVPRRVPASMPGRI